MNACLNILHYPSVEWKKNSNQLSDFKIFLKFRYRYSSSLIKLSSKIYRVVWIATFKIKTLDFRDKEIEDLQDETCILLSAIYNISVGLSVDRDFFITYTKLSMLCKICIIYHFSRYYRLSTVHIAIYSVIFSYTCACVCNIIMI